MREFYASIDTILWGRKSHDWLLAYYARQGKTEGLSDTRLKNYVFSKHPPARPAAGAEFVTEPLKAFTQRLRAAPRAFR